MIENSHFSYRQNEKLSGSPGHYKENQSLTAFQVEDQDLRQTIEIIQNLGDRIAVFLSRVRTLLQLESDKRDIRFLAEFFFNNFSLISENSKASSHIISYCIKRPQWLKKHADRIVESLKLLYTDLLSLELDCEQLYMSIFQSELHYDFGLNFHGELASLDEIVNYSTACRLLSLTPEANREEIKTSFRNLAKRLHPDLNPGADRENFIRLEMAYKLMLEQAGRINGKKCTPSV